MWYVRARRRKAPRTPVDLPWLFVDPPWMFAVACLHLSGMWGFCQIFSSTVFYHCCTEVLPRSSDTPRLAQHPALVTARRRYNSACIGYWWNGVQRAGRREGIITEWGPRSAEAEPPGQRSFDISHLDEPSTPPVCARRRLGAHWNWSRSRNQHELLHFRCSLPSHFATLPRTPRTVLS